jgi:hypothetical protein
MASQKQNRAVAPGAAFEGTHLVRRDASQDTANGLKSQDVVVGSVRKNGREEVRVTLKSFADLRQVDIRIFKNVHGVDVGTAQGCTVKPARLRGLIEVLERAEDVAKAEGLV